jgi:hypothetical protein
MKAIVDSIEHPHWVIQGWQIKFLLSDKLLHQAKLLSRVDNWYEDPVIADTWQQKVSVCFNSIFQFYDAFGQFPQVGDRLFNEESGMIVQDRSIDGNLKQMTFTLSI